MKRRRLSYLQDWLLLFLFVAILIGPLFRVKYLDNWPSIESTFIADARFLRDHWPHPEWQPNWYGGTRTDYVYPPALRYGTAVIMKAVPKVIPAKAYHLYIAFFYCFGIAAVYLLVRAGSGSRLAGWIAAAGTALVSPSYLLVAYLRADQPVLLPWRLSVLVRFGEGPHMTALAWIPLAMLFAYRGLTKWRPASLALASVCSAMVVSNNFYGATALALLFPVLVWSIYITRLDLRIWVRAAAIAALAYGLTALWLVPSYINLTLSNMRFVSEPGNLWSPWAFLALFVAFVLLTDRFAKGRAEYTYLIFVSGAAAVFLTTVVGHYYVGFRILGEPSRLFPELDLVIILFLVEMLRRFWSGVMWRKAAAAVVVLAALSPSFPYLRNSRTLFVSDPDHTARVEYTMQNWIATHMPDSRVLAAGSVRFWYNAWNDLPQVDGGSDQGILNPMVILARWHILHSETHEHPVEWLKAFGADAVLVNEPHSREHYHDFTAPTKFKDHLPVLHDDGEGNIIYGVPRRYRSLARVVDRARLDALPEIPFIGDTSVLTGWVDVLENGPEAPTSTEWQGTDALVVRAPVEQGQAVLIQVTYDSNWRAYAGGQRIPVRRNHLGLMTIDAPPGTREIRLEFPTPFSNKVGRAVTLLTMIVIAGLLYMRRL